MSRPNKEGLDYFNLNVNLDDKFELVEAKYGMQGFGIIIKLLQKIYKDYGYYYKWTETEQLLFSNKVSVDRKTVTSLVSDCIKWGLFNKILFNKYNILTSHGIQKRYASATYKRSCVEMLKEYLLVDVSDKKHIKITSLESIDNLVYDDKKPCYCEVSGDRKSVSDVSDVRNSTTSIVSDVKSTQSKVKYSRVQESKEKESIKEKEKDLKKINKKKKNNKKEKNTSRVNTPAENLPAKGKGAGTGKSRKGNYTDIFEKFWSIYPRQVEKAAAFKKFQVRLKDGYTAKELILAATRYSNYCKGKEKRFIKHGKTFLGPDKPFKDFLDEKIIESEKPKKGEVFDIDEYIRKLEENEKKKE